MTILAESQLQHKNFVPAQRDIRLRIKLTTAQADEVARLLLAAHPALADLRNAGQLQFINSCGQYRVAAVRGGQLPADITSEDVRCLADTVKVAQGDEGRYSALWADAQPIAYGRRGGR